MSLGSVKKFKPLLTASLVFIGTAFIAAAARSTFAIAIVTFIATAAINGFTPPAIAAPAPVQPEIKEGISAYNRAEYRAAVLSFNQSLNTEYNNPVVHYYLGNCFVHLNQPESAIREFRIAYALSPDTEVGKFSKDALKVFGVETDATGGSPIGLDQSKKSSTPKPNPALEQAINSLRNQTFFAKTNETKTTEQTAKETARLNAEHLERTKSDIMSREAITRRGKIIQKPLSQDSKKLLDDLKDRFDSQLNAQKKHGEQRVTEIQKTADNLESLLREQRDAKGPKLSPTGTNLYTRNYEHKKSEPEVKHHGDDPFAQP